MNSVQLYGYWIIDVLVYDYLALGIKLRNLKTRRIPENIYYK